MGRPIQKKWFGPSTGSGYQIVVNGVKFADGTTASDAYIVKQTGSSAYIVQDSAKTHAPEIVFMVNANSLSALMPGQCFITATPFGGSALPCAKIAQFRVDIYKVANTVPRKVGDPAVQGVDSYSWSTIPANAPGQADLITAASGAGVVLSVAVNNQGAGYFTVPAVSFTGGGTGATGTAVLTAGKVTSITVNAGGTGYTSGTMTVAAPPASVTATATATLTADAVTSIAVNLGGGYYVTAPAVTISGDGTGATATAIVTNGVVTSISVDAGGSGYTAATVTVAAPPAAVGATATATVSV